MDKNITVMEDQDVHELSALQDLNEIQLALIGGGIGETIL